MYESFLEEIGLTEGEAKVYEALLSLGPSTVGPIVKRSGVAYSNIYEILHRLSEKGLVSFILKQKTKYFQSEGLNRLKDLLSKQEQDLQAKLEKFQKLEPQLAKLKGLKNEEEAQVFIGEKGLLTAYEKLLQNSSKQDEGYFFYVYDKDYYQKTESFYTKLWHILRSYQNVWKGISNKELKGSTFAKRYPAFIHQRYVSFPLPSNTDILQDKVLITTWKEKPVGILSHSKEIAQSYKTYLQEIWQQAK